MGSALGELAVVNGGKEDTSGVCMEGESVSSVIRPTRVLWFGTSASEYHWQRMACCGASVGAAYCLFVQIRWLQFMTAEATFRSGSLLFSSFLLCPSERVARYVCVPLRGVQVFKV